MNEVEIEKNIFLTSEGLVVFKNLGLAAGADLHIGIEEAFGETLAHIHTRIILEKFLRVIKRFRITEVILNGDIKHTFGKECKQEWKEVSYFIRELLKKVKIKIVKGNHDFYIENLVGNFEVAISKEFDINGILFAHGDDEIIKRRNSLNKGKKKFLVIGNEHPCIQLKDEIGASNKYPCFIYAKKEKVIVLPAINPWTNGTNILKTQKEKFLSPILNTINPEEAIVYLTDGEQIYDFKKLKDVRKMLKKS